MKETEIEEVKIIEWFNVNATIAVHELINRKMLERMSIPVEELIMRNIDIENNGIFREDYLRSIKSREFQRKSHKQLLRVGAKDE